MKQCACGQAYFNSFPLSYRLGGRKVKFGHQMEIWSRSELQVKGWGAVGFSHLFVLRGIRVGLPCFFTKLFHTFFPSCGNQILFISLHLNIFFQISWEWKIYYESHWHHLVLHWVPPQPKVLGMRFNACHARAPLATVFDEHWNVCFLFWSTKPVITIKTCMLSSSLRFHRAKHTT